MDMDSNIYKHNYDRIINLLKSLSSHMENQSINELKRIIYELIEGNYFYYIPTITNNTNSNTNRSRTSSRSNIDSKWCSTSNNSKDAKDANELLIQLHDGNTILHLAIYYNLIEEVILLLSQLNINAFMGIKNMARQTPLDIAIEEGNQIMIQLLMKYDSQYGDYTSNSNTSSSSNNRVDEEDDGDRTMSIPSVDTNVTGMTNNTNNTNTTTNNNRSRTVSVNSITSTNSNILNINGNMSGNHSTPIQIPNMANGITRTNINVSMNTTSSHVSMSLPHNSSHSGTILTHSGSLGTHGGSISSYSPGVESHSPLTGTGAGPGGLHNQYTPTNPTHTPLNTPQNQQQIPQIPPNSSMPDKSLVSVPLVLHEDYVDWSL